MTLRAVLLCLTLLPFATSCNGCNRGDDDDDGATPLDAPINLAVTNGDGHYELTWDPVADATGYRVYEADAAGTDPATLTPIDLVAPPFSKTAVPNWVTKYYRVQAVAVTRPAGGLSAEIGAAGNAGWLITSRRSAATGAAVSVQRYHADEPAAPIDEIAGAELVPGGTLGAGAAQGVGVAAALYGVGPSTGYSEVGTFRSSVRVILANEASHTYRFIGFQDTVAPRVVLEDRSGGSSAIVSLSAAGGDARVLKAGCVAVIYAKSSPTGVAFACDEGTAYDYWASNGLDAAVKLPGGGTAGGGARNLAHVIGSRGFFYDLATNQLASQLLDGVAAALPLPTNGANESLATFTSGPNTGKPIVGAGDRILVLNFTNAGDQDLYSMGLDGSNPVPILINGAYPDVKSISPDGTRFTVVLAATTSFSYTFDATATQTVLDGAENSTDARFLDDGDILVFKSVAGPTIVDVTGAIVLPFGLNPAYVWISNRAGFAVLYYQAAADLTSVRLSDGVSFELTASTLNPLSTQFGDEGVVVFVDGADMPWIANPDVTILKQAIDATATTRVTPIGVGEGNRVFLQLTRKVSPYDPADLVMFDLDTKTTTPLIMGATGDEGWFFPN